MLSKAETAYLCRIGPGTAMGNLMRQYWVPAIRSDEVAEGDGAPLRVRLLGEDLIAFRDSDAKVGLIGEFCPHRNASLFYGRNEECGLRCLYHGWKVDVHGTVLEMSSEPPESGFPAKVKHKSYPTHEAAGFVWTYMAPAEEMPPFEAP